MLPAPRLSALSMHMSHRPAMEHSSLFSTESTITAFALSVSRNFFPASRSAKSAKEETTCALLPSAVIQNEPLGTSPSCSTRPANRIISCVFPTPPYCIIAALPYFVTMSNNLLYSSARPTKNGDNLGLSDISRTNSGSLAHAPRMAFISARWKPNEFRLCSSAMSRI